MLPFVGGLARELAKKQPNLGSSLTDAARRTRLTELRSAVPTALAQVVHAIDPQFRDWDYCLLANLVFLEDEEDSRRDSRHDGSLIRFLEAELGASSTGSV